MKQVKKGVDKQGRVKRGPSHAGAKGSGSIAIDGLSSAAGLNTQAVSAALRFAETRTPGRSAGPGDGQTETPFQGAGEEEWSKWIPCLDW